MNIETKQLRRSPSACRGSGIWSLAGGYERSELPPDQAMRQLRRDSGAGKRSSAAVAARSLGARRSGGSSRREQPPAKVRSRFAAVALALLFAATAHADCERCHKNIEPMHTSPAVHLACTDCHGGDAAATEKTKAHIQPLHPEIWKTSEVSACPNSPAPAVSPVEPLTRLFL